MLCFGILQLSTFEVLFTELGLWREETEEIAAIVVLDLVWEFRPFGDGKEENEFGGKRLYENIESGIAWLEFVKIAVAIWKFEEIDYFFFLNLWL